MHSAVERLATIMPPPHVPVTSPPWDDAPAELGFQFPRDYREFVDRYGGGRINGELAVLTPTLDPYQPGFDVGFRSYAQYAARDVGAAFDSMRRADPDQNPYPAFPAPGGLLVWASTFNGDYCFWRTRAADSDRWPVVLWLRHQLPHLRWREFDGGMAAFLLTIADGSADYTAALIGSPARRPRWTLTADWAHTYDTGI